MGDLSVILFTFIRRKLCLKITKSNQIIEHEVDTYRPPVFAPDYSVTGLSCVYIGGVYRNNTGNSDKHLTSDTHHCSCLGHLGLHDTVRIVSISCRIIQGDQGKNRLCRCC
jgi:hypothetical protein